MAESIKDSSTGKAKKTPKKRVPEKKNQAQSVEREKVKETESSILNLIDPLRAVTACNMNMIILPSMIPVVYHIMTGQTAILIIIIYGNSETDTQKEAHSEPDNNVFFLAPEKYQAGRREFDTEFYDR